jgi:hypothetical protein
MNTQYSFSASEDPTIESPGFATTRNFEAVVLGDVLENFTLFLKGVGFVFDGQLEFVDDSNQDNIEPQNALGDCFTHNTVTITQSFLTQRDEEIRQRTYDEIISEFKRQNKGFGDSMVPIEHVLAVLQNLSTQSQKD